MSILSFPDRGPWGDKNWRGNCSGFVYKDLFERLQPKVFVDPMMGSGTSIEVAREMNIEAYGLDLHAGFNALRDSILQKVGKEACLTISHPPYGEMIKYSGPGGMWGDAPHPDDLSHCTSDQDFHEKLQLVLLNQREATRAGGYYGTIIGDLRSKGRYVSYQAECIARMPANELAAVIIKAQHNTMSGRKSYGRMKLPLLTHEYVLLWQKSAAPLLVFLKTVAKEAQARLTGTWRNVVKQCLMGLGGQADLPNLYAAIEAQCDKTAANPHWRDKIRQVLNQTPELFKPVERGVWALA